MAGYKTEFLCTLSENKIFCAFEFKLPVKITEKRVIILWFVVVSLCIQFKQNLVSTKAGCVSYYKFRLLSTYNVLAEFFFDFFYMPENLRDLQELWKQFLVGCNTNRFCKFLSR